MQAIVKIYCDKHKLIKYLGTVRVDTAQFPEEVKGKIDRLVLAHRQECPYYKQK